MGTTVICIDDELSDGALTLGKTYKARGFANKLGEAYFKLDGIEGRWLAHRFQIVDGDAAPTPDVVNSPSHYTKGIQTYDYIKSWDMDFTTGNVIKYTTRAPYKGKRLEDLKKARWYLEKLIEEAEKDGNSQ